MGNFTLCCHHRKSSNNLKSSRNMALRVGEKHSVNDKNESINKVIQALKRIVETDNLIFFNR